MGGIAHSFGFLVFVSFASEAFSYCPTISDTWNFENCQKPILHFLFVRAPRIISTAGGLFPFGCPAQPENYRNGVLWKNNILGCPLQLVLPQHARILDWSADSLRNLSAFLSGLRASCPQATGPLVTLQQPLLVPWPLQSPLLLVDMLRTSNWDSVFDKCGADF